MANSTLKRYLPFTVTIFVVLLDQITKALVVKFIPENTVFKSLFWDFLEIIHVRNDAIAFSIGTSLDVPIKIIFFIILPIILMGLLIYCVCSKKTDKDFTYFQKWCLAGIAGGGIGNLIDRIFRGYVVDFISFTLFNKEMAIFNIADIFITIGVTILLVRIFKEGKYERIRNK